MWRFGSFSHSWIKLLFIDVSKLSRRVSTASFYESFFHFSMKHLLILLSLRRQYCKTNGACTDVSNSKHVGCKNVSTEPLIKVSKFSYIFYIRNMWTEFQQRGKFPRSGMHTLSQTEQYLFCTKVK